MSFQDEFQSALRKQERLRSELGKLDMELARLWDAMQAKEPIAPTASVPATEPPAPDSPLPMAPEAAKAFEPPVPAAEPPAPVSPPVIAAAPTGTGGGNLELRLGTYWFVRAGVLMLLTGLVFLANYAREYFFNALPPLGKVGVLYGLSSALLGAGLWLERGREELRNYAHVLAAGGVAAVYYTTFAAHKVASLRVIEDPVVAGILLLFWAAVIIAVSQRRQSQTLALLSILMAYFTCVIIDQATLFSLFSALLLTGAGVFLLLKNRWIAVSFASLAGTYLTFAYWRWPQLIEWLSGREAVLGHFWGAYGFLLGYWLLFTFAAFAARNDAFSGARRTLFATLNNAAFLALGSLGVLRHYSDHYGSFLLVVGAALLGLAALAHKRFADSGLLWRAYLVAGVLVITLGAIQYFSGFSLALVLAAESSALLAFSRTFRVPFLRAAGFVVAGLSVLYSLNCTWKIVPSLFGFFPVNVTGIPLVAALAQAAFLIAGGWIIRRGLPTHALRRGGSYGVLLGLAVFYLVAAPELPSLWRPAILSLAALACVLAFPPLRFPELGVLGQTLVLAGGHALLGGPADTYPTAAVLPILGVPLALAYWWKGKVAATLPTAEHRGLIRDALAAVAVLLAAVWLVRDVVEPHETWLYLGGLLGLGLLAAGMKSGLPSLAVFGQCFPVLGFIAFGTELGQSGWLILLVPIVLAAGTPLAFSLLRPGPDYRPGDRSEARLGTLLWRIAGFLPAAALVLTFAWVLEYIPAPWRALFFAALSLSLAPWATSPRQLPVLVYALAALAMGVLVCVEDLFLPAPFLWQHGLFCLMPGVLGYLFRKEWGNITAALALAAVLLGWRFISGEIAARTDGFYLTVSWTLYAFVVFGIGLALRDRTYRWLSLAILGAAVVRLLATDVWGLEPIPRIFSFIATGLVLVSLGFVYNRYQGFIRRYL